MFLSRIFVYPIKSARGIAVTETDLDTSGPVHDRRWMLVDEEGVFLSQRKLPRMTLIESRFEGADLVVTAPGMSPLVLTAPSNAAGELIPVTIWRDRLKLPCPNMVYNDWFSTFLERSCRLVYLPHNIVRRVEPPFDAPEWRVSLADGYPLLVVTEASLTKLNEQLTSPVGIERFRPNLVISETSPHEEDEWRRIQIGSVQLAVVKPCARCSIVLVDPSTGAVGIEPLRTLARYRSVPRGVMFGQNALVINPGKLCVGASVEVLDAAAHR
jgi:uncharacterized protein YcbX